MPANQPDCTILFYKAPSHPCASQSTGTLHVNLCLLLLDPLRAWMSKAVPSQASGAIGGCGSCGIAGLIDVFPEWLAPGLSWFPW